MCRTMKELERVVADYRSMKAMKEQIDAEVKSYGTLQGKKKVCNADLQVLVFV